MLRSISPFSACCRPLALGPTARGATHLTVPSSFSSMLFTPAFMRTSPPRAAGRRMQAAGAGRGHMPPNCWSRQQCKRAHVQSGAHAAHPAGLVGPGQQGPAVLVARTDKGSEVPAPPSPTPRPPPHPSRSRQWAGTAAPAERRPGRPSCCRASPAGRARQRGAEAQVGGLKTHVYLPCRPSMRIVSGSCSSRR